MEAGPMQDFRGKVAVITGGASGVGRALGYALAREGASIVLADIEADALSRTTSELAATGATAIGVVTDVTDPASVQALADRAFGEFGRVQMVFNNAGVGGGGAPSIWDTSVNVFLWAFEVNFFGVLNGFKAFVPRLIEQDEECVIAATASGAGLVFPPSAAAYASTKSALIALTEVLSFQLKMCGSKVRAACLFPGPHVVDTKLFDAQRNLLKRFDDGSDQFGGGITDIESFQQVMEAMIGRRVDITQPEDFAEYVLGALRREEFWILPLTQKTQDAVRARFEGMLNHTNPVIADML
jgi:NAD(P)-dependent dehydrogenase (short-subunit alcohol dehydrogenase family)